MDYSIAILIWIVCGIANVLIAQNRGATNVISWFLVGVLFGPIGIVLALIGAKPPRAVSGTPVNWPTSQQSTWTPTPPQPTWTPTPPSELPAAGSPAPAREPMSSASADAAYCPTCGERRTGSFRFCRKCGFDFDSQA